MRFDLNDEQRMLQRTAREFFSAEASSKKVRQLFAEDRFGREIWEGIAAQGWLGVLVDERHGGLGLSLGELFPVLEEAGRVPAPVPLVESAVMATALSAVPSHCSRKRPVVPAVTTSCVSRMSPIIGSSSLAATPSRRLVP